MVELNGQRAPEPLNAAVSAQMQRMPRYSTGPEVSIRRELHHRGLRFRVNYRRLPGRPDIAFTGARIAVFIDGCFWHSCPSHGVLPKNNRDWWRHKLARNVERDRAKDAQLAKLGWIVVHIWEHEQPTDAADAIEWLWRSARGIAARRPSRAPREREM
jgi:DNA mismatch endonuclease (patch repair protein)